MCVQRRKKERNESSQHIYMHICIWHMTFDRSQIARGTKMNNVQHTLHIAYIHYNYGEYYRVYWAHTTSTWRHWRFVIKPKTKCARIKKGVTTNGKHWMTKKKHTLTHARTHNNYVELLLKLILVLYMYVWCMWFSLFLTLSFSFPIYSRLCLWPSDFLSLSLYSFEFGKWTLSDDTNNNKLELHLHKNKITNG